MLTGYNYEIIKHICVIGKPHSQGWTKELNLVSWNGYPAKYEIRDWSPDHQRCGKGVNFTENELQELSEQLQILFK